MLTLALLTLALLALAVLALALLTLALLTLAPLTLVPCTLLALYQFLKDQLSIDQENESLLLISLTRWRASTFTVQLKSLITMVNSQSISLIISGYSRPPITLAVVISTYQTWGWPPTMFDIIA